MAKACVKAGFTPLDAVTVPVNGAATVGVPLTAPVFALRLTPVGSAPAVTAQVGVGLPVPVYVCEYVTPRVPLGGGPLVITGATAGLEIVMLKFCEKAGAIKFHATTVPENRPATVRVPVIAPVVLFEPACGRRKSRDARFSKQIRLKRSG